MSHDSGFLDNVCTDIIHYEKRKLVRYKGNLSEFVKVSAPPFPWPYLCCNTLPGRLCLRHALTGSSVSYPRSLEASFVGGA